MINPEVDFDFNMKKVPDLPLVYRGQWTVPASLGYFRGHFPENPIFPAVAILEGSLEAVKKILRSRVLEFQSLRSAKFTHLITAQDQLELTATQTLVETPAGQRSRWRIEWILLPERKIAADLVFEVRSRSEV